MGNTNSQDEGRPATGVYVARSGPRSTRPEPLVDVLGALAIRTDDAELALAVIHLRHGRGVNRVPAAAARTLRWLSSRLVDAADDLDETPSCLDAVRADLGDLHELLGLLVEEMCRADTETLSINDSAR